MPVYSGAMGAVIDKRIVFAGCARDCAAALPKVLANVDRIAGLFADADYVLMENDSKDTTKNLLREWCSSRPTAHLITRDDFNISAPRTIRLAQLRGEYTALVKGKFADRDYLAVLDCDDVNSSAIDLDAVMRSIDFLAQDRSCAGASANSVPYYYDLWAFRHPELCPSDFWEDVLDYAVRFRVSDAEAYTKTLAKRTVQLPRDGPPLEVDSAFGGFAIYKMSSVLKNRAPFTGYKRKVLPSRNGPTQVGLQVSEHVSFHAGFRARGDRLFVLPWLVNCTTRNQDSSTAKFRASTFRNLIFDLRATRSELRGSMRR